MPKKIKRRIFSKKATPADGIKMSEVIMDFAKPLLNFSEDDGSKDKAISVAILSWNLALLPQDAQREELKKILHSYSKEDAQVMDDVVNIMVQRRSVYFPDIKKFIVGYEIVRRGDNVELLVASTERWDFFRSGWMSHISSALLENRKTITFVT
jgi:hypothetical protein